MLNLSSWNTWDIRCLNAVMKIPDMAELRVAVYDTDTHLYQDEFLWSDVVRFGYHHPGGEYFDIDLKFIDDVFSLEFASQGEMFVYRITFKKEQPRYRLNVATMFRWGAKGNIIMDDSSITMSAKDCNYILTFSGQQDRKTLVNTSHQGILFDTGSPVYINCNTSMTLAEMDEFLKLKREECIKNYSQGEGTLSDTPQAIIKGLTWNTIFEPIGNRICSPVTRAWCTGNGVGFGSYVLFEWDTFFASLLSAVQDKNLSYQQVRSIMQEMTEDGMIPNFGAQNACSIDRSQPPVGAYCILKLYKQFGETSLLEETYDNLIRWNSWWMRNRDGNGDGLLEWGSNPYPEGLRVQYEADNQQAAMYESGLDNSPMYDDVVYNKKTHTMEYADVGLNSLYAMDCWALAEISRILGKTEQAGSLEKEYSRMREAMQQQLWDEKTGIFLNRHWDGRFHYRLSPTNFYPLISGVATPDQAERMVKEHLLNENEFWGRYVIPSISRNDPAFHDNDYWRGRIWGPMNFLMGEGLKRYSLHDVAYQFAQKSQLLFQKEWEEKNHIHENYNAVTGEGCDVKNADPVYHWGGLLGYLAISELIEAQPWSGMRFGNLNGDYAVIRNFPVGKDSTFVVIMDKGLSVLCNGSEIIKTGVPVIIRGYVMDGDSLHFEIVAEKPGNLVLKPDPSAKNVIVMMKGKTSVLDRKDEMVIPFS